MVRPDCVGDVPLRAQSAPQIDSSAHQSTFNWRRMQWLLAPLCPLFGALFSIVYALFGSDRTSRVRGGHFEIFVKDIWNDKTDLSMCTCLMHYHNHGIWRRKLLWHILMAYILKIWRLPGKIFGLFIHKTLAHGYRYQWPHPSHGFILHKII